jgi:hypothetical protein
MEALLAETLKLWGVEGSVEGCGDGYGIHVNGRRVARVAPGRGARWIVGTDDGEHECISVAGALSALRAALGVESGARLRITR